jgi:uncharacterized protein YjbJ (UPF0337 family)
MPKEPYQTLKNRSDIRARSDAVDKTDGQAVLSRIDEDMTMAKTWDEIASRWTRFSRDVKKNWGNLSDDEVMEVNGRREMLAEKIQ